MCTRRCPGTVIKTCSNSVYCNEHNKDCCLQHAAAMHHNTQQHGQDSRKKACHDGTGQGRAGQVRAGHRVTGKSSSKERGVAEEEDSQVGPWQQQPVPCRLAGRKQ